MKSFLSVLVFCFVLISLSQAQEYYVKRKSGVFKSTISVKIFDLVKNNDFTLSRIQLENVADDDLAALKAQDDILWIEPIFSYEALEIETNFTSTPNDIDYTSGLQNWLTTLNAPKAWEIGTGSSEIVIAIIDTGVELTHSDLAANVWINPNEIANNGIDDDENGFIDDINGWDFYSKSKNPSPQSNSNNHGTHVAGLASAVTNNGLGIASLSFNTKFMPIKISDNSGKNLSYGAEAILYAINNGADIINCSWGSTRYSKALEEVVNYAWSRGVLVIAAAGNDGNTSVYYPAGYSNVIAVGSVDYRTFKKSTFSNYGGFVDVLAPGGESTDGIYSTLTNNSYGTSFGTSMASPIVASLAGLVKSIRTDWDISTIRAQIEKSGIPIDQSTSTFQYKLGNGLIQADKALSTTLKPLAKVYAYNFGDSLSISSVFNRNDEITVSLSIENLGIDQNNLQIKLISLSNFLTVKTTTAQSITIDHATNKKLQPFVVQVTPDTPVNTKAEMRIEFTYSDLSTSNEIISVQVVPNNMIHTANTIELGLNGYGRLGYFNYPTNSSGKGFIIKKDGTTSSELKNTPLLREGGLFFGSSETRISNSVRGQGSNVDNEFFLVDYFESEFNAAKGVEKGKALFTDLNAGIESIRFDILTTLESFAQTNELDANYILIKYTLQNTTLDTNYPLLRAGIFLDFDMPFNDNLNDIVFYDQELDAIAQFSGGIETDTTLYVGASIVEGIFTPWLIDNNSTSSFYFGINPAQNGFEDKEKWLSLYGREVALQTSRKRIGPANTSFVISPASFSLAPEESKSFTLILAYGEGYENYKETIERARTNSPLVTTNEELQTSRPSQLSILQNFPNPFNPSTQIQFQNPSHAFISLDVFDLLGRKVSSIKPVYYSAGTHQIKLNATHLSSGVYIIRLSNSIETISHKITLIK